MILRNKGLFLPLQSSLRKIPTDAHGNVIELNSKGFETLELDFLLTAADAQELVDIMRGHGVNPETGLKSLRRNEMPFRKQTGYSRS